MARGRLNFVSYGSEDEYREHYRREYRRKEIYTSDGIRVYFGPDQFDHAFYEGSYKSQFSKERAARIDWIGATLANPETCQFFGWDKNTGSEMFDRRVELYKGFVVVLRLKMDKRQHLKADFITCFPMSMKTHRKIKGSLPWNKDCAVKALGWERKWKRKGER